MKRRGLQWSIVLLLICLLTGCGYNHHMYDYLSDRNNYKTYTVQIEEIIYPDEDSDKTFLRVTFSSYEEVKQAKGYEADREKPLSEYIEVFSLCPENHQSVAENGFYDEISVGDTIEITASAWIYMDGYFYYIIGVRGGEKEYLNPDEGMKNVIEMMNGNRGVI